jgi:hypothetical protein
MSANLTTFERVHAALTVANDLEDKLEFLCQGGYDDLRTRLLISEEVMLAHVSAQRALKHLLAAVQMAANAEADAANLRINQIAAE